MRNPYNGGIPIGMEMESPSCIRAYKASLREEAEKHKKKRKIKQKSKK